MATPMDGGRRWRTLGWGALGALLLLPALAMLVTEEMNWGAEDFLAAALLLGALGLGMELVARFVPRGAARGLAAVAVLGAVLLVWAELAVGLFH